MYAAPMQNFVLEFALEKLQCEVKSLFEEKEKKKAKKKKKALCCGLFWPWRAQRTDALLPHTVLSSQCVHRSTPWWLDAVIAAHSLVSRQQDKNTTTTVRGGANWLKLGVSF